MQWDGGCFLHILISSAHALRCRVARKKADGTVETLDTFGTSSQLLLQTRPMNHVIEQLDPLRNAGARCAVSWRPRRGMTVALVAATPAFRPGAPSRARCQGREGGPRRRLPRSPYPGGWGRPPFLGSLRGVVPCRSPRTTLCALREEEAGRHAES